jgi:hypothetical protein
MSKPEFDKNESSVILSEALGILDSLLVQPKEGK